MGRRARRKPRLGSCFPCFPGAPHAPPQGGAVLTSRYLLSRQAWLKAPSGTWRPSSEPRRPRVAAGPSLAPPQGRWLREAPTVRGSPAGSARLSSCPPGPRSGFLPWEGQDGRRVTGERPAASGGVLAGRGPCRAPEGGRGAWDLCGALAHWGPSSLTERVAPGAQCGEDVPVPWQRPGHRGGSHVREPVELPVRTLGGPWGWAPSSGELGQAGRAGRPGSCRLGPSAEGSGPGPVRGQSPTCGHVSWSSPLPRRGAQTGGGRGRELPQEQRSRQDLGALSGRPAGRHAGCSALRARGGGGSRLCPSPQGSGQHLL